MSLPSIVSYGAAAKTSSLVWDSDLTIPDGFSIESASGEVGIVGDVSISGSLNTEGGISSGGNVSAAENVTATENLIGINAVLNNKPLVIGENVGNASVTLTQIPSPSRNYTSADFAITGQTGDVLYIVPPVTYYYDTRAYMTSTFSIQAKLTNGTYKTISSVSLYTQESPTAGSTQAAVTPIGTTALRYTISSNATVTSNRISSDLTLALTPIPVY